MKTYKDLQEAIRKELPELMEVSSGCLVIQNECLYKIDHLKGRGEDEIVFFHMIKPEPSEWEYSEQEYLDSFKESTTIIGHSIQLHHVLKWWLRLKNEFMQFGEGTNEFFFYDFDSEESESHEWILGKGLKDQSEETKKYLISLL